MPTDSCPIEDPGSLPGEKVFDQEDAEIGTVKRVYETEDGDAMWVSIEASFSLGDKREVLVPIARLKQEGDRVRVPYSKGHIEKTPELEADDQVSEEDDGRLRDHYGIDRSDHEQRTDNESYASRVPAERGTASRATDTSD